MPPRQKRKGGAGAGDGVSGGPAAGRGGRVTVVSEAWDCEGRAAVFFQSELAAKACVAYFKENAFKFNDAAEGGDGDHEEEHHRLTT